MKHEFYYWVNSDEAGNDLVLYTGDPQPILPEGAFRLSEAVVDLAERLGVCTLITVGAFITGRISDKPKVYGAASDSDHLKELKALDIKIIHTGAITWRTTLI